MARHLDRVRAGTIGQGHQGTLYGARAWRHADRVRLRFSWRRITEVRVDPGNAASPYGRYIAAVTNSTEALRKFPPRFRTDLQVGGVDDLSRSSERSLLPNLPGSSRDLGAFSRLGSR